MPVTDTERRFWLTRFTDNDLASFASALFDIPFCPDRFAAARTRLVPARRMRREAVVMVATAVGDELERE